MQANIKKQEGFTIVELLIAAAVLTIGILAWGKTLDSSIRGRAISNSITIASDLAMNEFENDTSLLYDGKTVNSKNYSKVIENVEYTIKLDKAKGTRPENISPIHMIKIDVLWSKYGNKNFKFERIVAGG